MQEDITQRTIALSIRTGRLTKDVLKKALEMYLDHRRNKANSKHGKISLKKLVGQDQGAVSIEVNRNNIISFEEIAKKYNIDFAVKKDKTEHPPKYLVFFKGKDKDVMELAFKEFVYGNEKNKDRVSVKEKLNHFIDLAKKQDKQRQKVRHKEREQSL